MAEIEPQAKLPPAHRQPFDWTSCELGTLTALLGAGLSNREIAEQLGRPDSAVIAALNKYRPILFPGLTVEQATAARKRAMDETRRRRQLDQLPKPRVDPSPTLPARRCLGTCGNVFVPKARFNRICPLCTDRIKSIGPDESHSAP